jgi:hypothetical protein
MKYIRIRCLFHFSCLLFPSHLLPTQLATTHITNTTTHISFPLNNNNNNISLTTREKMPFFTQIFLFLHISVFTQIVFSDDSLIYFHFTHRSVFSFTYRNRNFFSFTFHNKILFSFTSHDRFLFFFTHHNRNLFFFTSHNRNLFFFTHHNISFSHIHNRLQMIHFTLIFLTNLFTYDFFLIETLFLLQNGFSQ